jgi:CPA2 family monovalent cation:H+ antiporter-2
MPHHTPLIATLVVGLVVAFVFGALAQRMRIPRWWVTCLQVS